MEQTEMMQQQPRPGISPMRQTGLSRVATNPIRMHREAIGEIQLAKGKAYSEVLVKLYGHLAPAQQERKVADYLDHLALLFVEYGCTDQAVVRVVRRCRESEFKGTSYTPLPDEGAIIRIINEVNQGLVTEDKPVEHQGQWMTPPEVRAAFSEFWSQHT